jgi:hypothetical protein
LIEVDYRFTIKTRIVVNGRAFLNMWPGMAVTHEVIEAAII